MQKTIFEYESYKLYITERIENSPGKGRGIKLKMSQYLNCQTAYISQVLNGETNFSFEQAAKLNIFFDHDKEESRYFQLLVHLKRAGNQELKDFLKSEMREILDKRLDLKHRLNVEGHLKSSDQQIYYSSWLYACVHMMSSVPELQTPLAMARHLNISKDKIMEVVTFLEETGLIVKKGSHYELGVTRIHLPKESPLIQRHHMNWRMQAIHAIDINDPKDLHYSTLFSVSHQDIPKIKEVLIKAIEECREIVRESKEEKIQSICIDFFGT
ncbi:MAG: TIGR02147 family protein [Bacteriovoracaceae bacterium]